MSQIPNPIHEEISFFNDAWDKLDNIEKEAKNEKKQVIIQLAKKTLSEGFLQILYLLIVNPLCGRV
ncbi:MAG: hypothetical protein JO297_01680 [Nitrososphaeraceae archaeon]|nr:hypothetical protein [Nitrososphaeraceae archaeon]